MARLLDVSFGHRRRGVHPRSDCRSSPVSDRKTILLRGRHATVIRRVDNSEWRRRTSQRPPHARYPKSTVVHHRKRRKSHAEQQSRDLGRLIPLGIASPDRGGGRQARAGPLMPPALAILSGPRHDPLKESGREVMLRMPDPASAQARWALCASQEHITSATTPRAKAPVDAPVRASSNPAPPSRTSTAIRRHTDGEFDPSR